MTDIKPSTWADVDDIREVAESLSYREVEALLRFADTIDALLIDETRGIDSGFSVRDARHNLLRSTKILQTLRGAIKDRQDT